MAKMKCCKECPEYDLCDEKKGCCDMCDFYSPKTKKCAHIKKKKKDDKEVLSRKKVEEEEEEEEVEPLEDEPLKDITEELSDEDMYADEEMDDFFNT
jgi:hypothetical protein